jgi:hypothetical protein
MGSVHPARSAKQVVKRVVAPRKANGEDAGGRASRKLRGRYIAAVRQLHKSQRTRLSEIAKAKGREAGISAIKEHRREVLSGFVRCIGAATTLSTR